MKKVVNICGSKLCNIALFCLLLPNILFALGWLDGILGILYMVIICWAMLYAFKLIKKGVLDTIEISLNGIILIILGAVIIVWISGIGGYFPLL